MASRPRTSPTGRSSLPIRPRSAPCSRPSARLAARPLKVGVQLPEVEYVASWAEQREMARTAEGIGLDSLWLGDHLLYQWDGRPSRGPWEAWTSLAAIAAVTERGQIGPLVAATSFHNPGMIAKKAATLDEIS